MTAIHADIDALKELYAVLARYRHAQRDVAARGEDQIRLAQASLAAKASQWRYRLELGQADFAACQDRAVQAPADSPVDCSGYARAIEQSGERLEQIRRWQQRIETEASEFQGIAGRFLDLLENELPGLERQLLAIIGSLEAARRVQAPGA